MALYVHYEADTGEIKSYQEAPEGSQDPVPAGLEVLKLDFIGKGPDTNVMKVAGGKLVAA